MDLWLSAGRPLAQPRKDKGPDPSDYLLVPSVFPVSELGDTEEDARYVLAHLVSACYALDGNWFSVGSRDLMVFPESRLALILLTGRDARGLPASLFWRLSDNWACRPWAFVEDHAFDPSTDPLRNH